MNKNMFLPAAILVALCAEDATAGEYVPVAGYNPINGQCVTNLNNDYTYTNGQYTREMNDPPSTDPYYSASATWETSLLFKWKWVPNGPLQDDPAPARSGSYTHQLSGQVECRAIGQARSSLVVNLNTYWPGGVGYQGHPFSFSSDTAGNSPLTLLGGGTNPISLTAEAGGYLSALIKLQANSHSHVDAYPNAEGIGRATNTTIKVTSMTLVP